MVDAQVTGIFPRSSRLVKATRDYDRNVIGWNTLIPIIREDSRESIEIQRSNGFKYINDGMYLWQDIFRPFTEGVKGITAGALTRWFDNNTFYRKPVIENLEPENHDAFLHRYVFLDLVEDYEKKVILPGLYTFASLSSQGYSRDLIFDLAGIMAVELRDLERRGVEVFQFNEPSLVYRNPKLPEMDEIREAYEIVRRSTGSTIILHTYFGDASPIIEDLLDMPVDYIGIDFYATEFMEIKDVSFHKGLLCGCVDSRNSYIEEPEKIVELVNRIEESMAPRDIILAPNCDLEFLTKDIAKKKVEILGKVKRLLGGD